MSFIDDSSANQIQTSTNAVSLPLALTLTAPGAGLFQYITSLYIAHTAQAAITAAAAGTITVTNLGAAGATTRWTFPNTGAIGAYTPVVVLEFAIPLKCFGTGNSSIVFASSTPTTGGLLTATVSFYIGP
jgi:hypothetical protein